MQPLQEDKHTQQKSAQIGSLPALHSTLSLPFGHLPAQSAQSSSMLPSSAQANECQATHLQLLGSMIIKLLDSLGIQLPLNSKPVLLGITTAGWLR